MERDLHLRFKGTQPIFIANSVDAAQDAFVVQAGTAIQINKTSKLSIGYSGLVAKNQQDNSIDMKVSVSF